MLEVQSSSSENIRFAGKLPDAEPKQKPLESIPSVSPLFGQELPSEPSMPAASNTSSEATLPSKPSITPPSKGSGMSTGRLQGFASELGGSLPTVSQDFYQVEGEMARGGLGKILKAKDTRLGRDVAVKELLRDQGNAKARFLREALITSRLQHPAIVPIYEAGRWPSGELFYTMKLVSGRPLDKLITEADSLEKRLALLPNAQVVCEAMAYAHDQRVIHRDLKPQNVLVGDYGETVVIDWGLAKDLKSPHEDEKDEADEHYRAAAQKEGLTITGEVMGTPAYMPMEQAKGQPVDERADVYALGAMLYHILTGQPPYRDKATRSREVLFALLQGPPMPLEEKVKDIPRDLVAIVNKAMEREPEKRYATAKELAHELQKFQTGQLVGAHQYTFSELVSRFVKKNKTAVLVGASLAALLVLLTAYYFVKINIESAAKDNALSASKRSQLLAETQRERAEGLQKTAEERARDERRSAQELRLKQAKNALESDPTMALAWLKQWNENLSPEEAEKAPWGKVRTIAADAISRGVPTVLGADWNSTGEGHNGEVTSIAFSPDDTLLASTSADNTVRLWDVEEKKLRFVLSGHTDTVKIGVFSSDGKLFASGAGPTDSTVKLWDTQTGKLINTLSGHSGYVYALAFSPDGKTLASAGADKVIRLWDLQASDKAPTILTRHTGDIRVITFSPTGEYLASGGFDGRVVLWDTKALTPTEVKAAGEEQIWSIVFSPDESLLSYGGNDNSGLNSVFGIFNIKSKSRILPNEPSLVVANSLRFSNDGSWLVAGFSNGSAKIFDLKKCSPRSCEGAPISEHKGSITNLIISNHSDFVISSGFDNKIEVCSILTRRCFSRLQQSNPNKLTLSSDDKYLASAGLGSTVLLWETASITGRYFSHTAIVRDVAFSPDGSYLAAGDDSGVVNIWDYKNNKLFVSLKHHTKEVFTIAFSPDGSMFASAGNDNKISIFETKSFTLIKEIKCHTNAINALIFYPDNKKIASGSSDNTVQLWDIETGKSLWVSTDHIRDVFGLDLSPNGETLVSTDYDHVLKFMNAKTGALLREVKVKGCMGVKYAPDGSQLALAGCSSALSLFALSDPSTIQGEPIEVLGHQDIAVKPVYSTTGDRIATAGWDDAARLWDRASLEGRSLQSYGGDVEGVAISPDGSLVAFGSDDGLVHLYRDELPLSSQSMSSWLRALPTPIAR